MKSSDDLAATLDWIICRIEEEAEKNFLGKKANWKKAAVEAVEEAYGALGRREFRQNKPKRAK